MEVQNTKYSGQIRWQSPSNIALIKYWGKYGNQLPMNPSISFSLKYCYTETTLFYRKKEVSDDKVALKFFLEEQERPDFEKRVLTFFEKIKSDFEFIARYDIIIKSKNTFPHSSGIASSASSMSSIVLCLCSMANIVRQTSDDHGEDFFHRVSSFARLASGSASRSVYGEYALWGQTEFLNNSSDNYAVPIGDKVHTYFSSLKDSILIVSSEKKELSSSAGHQRMKSNYFASTRYEQARDNLSSLYKALQAGHFDHFAEIVESEALTLHSMMLTSHPWTILMKPNTINILNEIKHFRNETKTQLAFTLDAGPNVHLIYPDKESKKVTDFIENNLKKYCENEKWIDDEIGAGPSRLK